MSLIRLGLVGYGRMGAAIAAAAQAEDNVVVTCAVQPRSKQIEPVPGLRFVQKIEDVFASDDVDVVLDFTHQTLFQDVLAIACRYGKPFVSGTTGLKPEDKVLFDEASQSMPFLHTTNTSVSMGIFRHNVRETARLVTGRGYDVHIHEIHHNQKKDAPSGTALTLAEDVVTGSQGTIKPEITAERGGTIPGYHQVTFYGRDEVIKLSHNVQSRLVFANGAVAAAKWIAAGRPRGLYTMDHVLGLDKK